MSYRKPIGIDTLTLPSNPEYHVRMRARGTYGAQRAASSAMLQVVDDFSEGAKKAVTKAEFGAYVGSLILSLVVDWNLTDENENPIPVTLEEIDKLEPEDGKYLGDEATRRMALRSGAAEENFKTPPSD